MAQAALRHIVIGLAATGLLMGCVESAGTGGTGTGSPGPSATVVAPGRGGAARDVEAPEVYQTTDSALWDGRPSLGGIWVAAPDVTNPERVLMFNPATGKSVQGALFRRERDNPGPRLQISSDAAEALGILAGQPVEIRVTALRREEPEPEAEVPAATPAVAEAGEDGAADPSSTSDGEADPAATAAAATAAIAAAGAVASDAEGVADAATDPAAADAATGTEAAVGEAPKRKTWKERRAEAKAAREAKKAEAAAAKAAQAAGTAPEVAATAAAAGVAAVETAPLEADSADTTGTAEAEVAPVTEPPKSRRQIRAEDAAAAAAAKAAADAQADAQAAAAPATAAADSADRQIQVASFSSEANATRAIEALSKIDITARTRKSEAGGKVVWGVVATGDAKLLQSIKDAGFADAFFLQ